MKQMIKHFGALFWNIIAIIAIALTSLLFTSLFTIAMSINATNQNYQFRSVGTYSHGSFKDVNEEQIAALSANPKVKASGTRTVIGLCTSGAFEKNYGEVSYMSDNTAKWSYAQPTSGRMPRSGNEIAMDTTALALLGVTPELGAQVTFTYTIADKEQLGSDVTDTFTLVGWWDYDRLMDVHYTETQHISRKPRVTRRVTPFSMACANLGRGAKKTALVIISLALAVVLLDLLSALLGGFDMDKYLSHSICADFIVSTPDYFNYRGIMLTKEDISPVMANTEQSRGGFTYTSAPIYTYLLEEIWMDEAAHYMRVQNAEDMLAAAEREGDKISAVSQIEALDPALMDKVRVIDGDISPLLDPDSRSIAIDVSLDDSGNLPDPDIYPAVGDRVKVTFDTNGRQWDAEYTVCALVEIPYTMTSRFYTMGYRVLMGVEALTREVGEEWVFPMAYVFDAPDDEAEAEAESYLSKLSSSAGSSVMYESKATKREHFHEFQMTFAVLGGLLCAIIGIVGILNFFNAMMTSVLSRQREFAVLHAVGQSAKQLKAMLIWEGLLYTVGAGSISLLLSAVINPLAGRIFENAYWFYSYRFTMTPVLLAIPAFALLGCVIPAIMYKQSTKRSIVECLREAEN